MRYLPHHKKEVWYPEDYVDLPTENVCAKETRDAIKCRSDFYKKGVYKKY